MTGTQLLILYFIILAAIYYVLLIAPQRRRQKERQQLIQGVKNGDTVITVGGLHGTVKRIKEDVVNVEIAKDVVVTISKEAIGTVVPKEPKVKQEKTKAVKEAEATKAVEPEPEAKAVEAEEKEA